ncbi:MAG: OmpA family protein [Prolixibacteraceae bacterium]
MKRIGVFLFFQLFICTSQAQIFETINDKFHNNSSGWLINTEGENTSIIKDSVYYIHNQEAKNEYFGTFIIDPNYNYTIEAKLTQTEGDKWTSYGLVWGNYIDTDQLNFIITSKKKFHIEGKINNRRVLIKNWNRSGKIKKKGISNILTIKKQSRVTKYYINNKRVYTSDNYPLVGTELGFVINGNADIKVDYVKVSTIKQTLYLVDDPVTGNQLQNLGPKVNSAYSERGPVITPDGKILYLTRTHPDNINGVETDDIWLTSLDENNEWKELQHPGFPLNNNGNNFVVSVTPDGNTLLLGNTYKRDGSPDKSGISISTLEDGQWQVPKKQTIQNYENKDAYGSFFLTADGTKLIICAENENSFGDLDLFVCFLKKPGRWSEPINMGHVVNSFASDFAPFLASDGKTLYFSSYGHKGYGSSDIFVSKRLDDTWENWSIPKNLGPEINTKGWDAYYCTSAKGDYAYMVSSKKDISYGLEDIFKIETVESAKPDPVVLVSGYAFNEKTNQLINAEIRYENLKTGVDEGHANATTDNGYKLVLPKGESYGFRAVSEGFYAVSQNIDLSDLEAFEEKQVNLYLVPIERGLAIRLNNIFFEFDKAALQPQSFSELNRLVNVLKENPKIEIAIAGHTDDKGSDLYNLELSDDRAKEVRQYLIDNGIEQYRITSQGYGETQPISTNSTEEGQQMNRRVEFTIL